MIDLPIVLAALTGIAFTGAGVANAAGADDAVAKFRRWGYPRGWHLVTAGLEICGAALLILPASRAVGYALLGGIMLAALATLMRSNEGRIHLLPPAALLLLIVAGAATAPMPFFL